MTGINDEGVIDGAYSSGSVYGGFAAAPSKTPDTTLNPYTTFAAESDGTRNTYLSGLDNGTGRNVNSEFMAGYAAGSGGYPQGVVLRGSGGWTGLISDPSQGSGTCAVTEVLGINDSRMGVGFYDTGSGSGPCTEHAFEFYSNVGLTTPYTFVNLTPTDPFGCSQSATSAAATGINVLGDVVGYVTCTTGSSPLTAAWMYRQLKYSTLCYTPNVTAISCNAN
ncbi:MAG TPA: hypothetical protein VGX91_04190 [Candidatus Cybelea sp.]|nr:hypothetical protein [Candidatus Cybelea sp.]